MSDTPAMALRIAIVAPEYPGCGPSHGVGRYLGDLAAGLRAAGHAVLVLVVNRRGRFVVDEAGKVHRHGLVRVPAVLLAWHAAPWLRSRLAAWSPDVIEASNWGGLSARLGGPWPVILRLSTPVAASPVPGALRRLALPLHRYWEREAVTRADLVIADSRAMAALARRCYRRAADAIVAHGIAVDAIAVDAIARPPRPAATSDEVLFVGRLEARKGIDRLLRAWLAVHRRHPQARLHLVGQDRLGIGARLPHAAALGVRIHGRLAEPELDALRARCAIQVVPSRFESFGLVVLEAWQHGLAVVASDRGALPEVVASAGRLAADHHALAATLSELLADPDRCRQLAARGARRLRTQFSRERMVAASLVHYRRAMAVADPRASGS